MIIGPGHVSEDSMWAAYVCLSSDSEDSQSNYGAQECAHFCALLDIRAHM